ncbi:MAG: hypothetical protein DHS20C18_32980 [Saprospiraceae bacterium]|nr:MAG: hypothetical protein DHS20C18_32980 [Saprospiraceae bacterium]
MVLQRHLPIPVWGTASAGSEVVVRFEKVELKTQVDADGNWRVSFPARSEGGPFELSILGDGKSIVFKDILVGEVWLCSGQSNMEWSLKRTAEGEREIPNANNPNIRLFHLKKKHDMYKSPFTQEQLESFTAGDFFYPAKWEKCSPETAAVFSGVGYFFGKTLQDSLQIPIGLIQNAVGGSPIQSWISEEAFASHPQLNYFVKFREGGNWLDLENINPWLKERALQNWADWVNQEKSGELPGHPFAPTYLFESAIQPLQDYPLRGVIWYQGESNATNPENYAALFELMVKNWRQTWQLDLPFYFIQLPKIGTRNLWPEFREAQEKCLAIQNTGMVVAIDGGHPTNVHPKEKEGISQRLANLALAKTYGKMLLAESPMLSTFEWQKKDRQIVLNFKQTYGGLKISRGEVPTGFLLQGYLEQGSLEAFIIPEKIRIENEKIILNYPENFLPVNVKYAWAPAPDNNIVNSENLPLAPFKILLGGRD